MELPLPPQPSHAAAAKADAHALAAAWHLAIFRRLAAGHASSK